MCFRQLARWFPVVTLPTVIHFHPAGDQGEGVIIFISEGTLEIKNKQNKTVQIPSQHTGPQMASLGVFSCKACIFFFTLPYLVYFLIFLTRCFLIKRKKMVYRHVGQLDLNSSSGEAKGYYVQFHLTWSTTFQYYCRLGVQFVFKSILMMVLSLNSAHCHHAGSLGWDATIFLKGRTKNTKHNYKKKT